MVKQDRRNPYVILGVPFAASGEEARAGFARVSRRLRRDHDLGYTQEDLTWALHQIEQIITNPELAFDVYRIPASPEVFADEEPGVFCPSPHPIPRATRSDPEEWATVRRQALSAAMRRVLAQKIPRSSDHVPYE